MSEARDQELRVVRQNDLKVQAERDQKFDWWQDWYEIDPNRDDKATRDELMKIIPDRPTIDAILNVIGGGKDHITKDETYRFVIDLERPGKARIAMLQMALDTNYDGMTSLEDWLK